MTSQSAVLTVKHLDHLNLTVRDLDETLAWYGRVFDFVRVEGGVRDGVRWAIIRAGEAMLCVYEHAELVPPKAWTKRIGVERLHGINHFGLRVADEAEWEARMKAEGIKPLYDGAVRWPHSTAYYVLDPTGYEIEVVVWKGDQITF